MLTPDQFLASQKANLETLNGLTAKAFEGVERLVELNLQAAKATMAESHEHAQALLSVKDAQELINLQANMMQPLAEKAAAYSRHLFDIASGTSGELNRALEAQVAQGQAQLASFVDSATQNAPAGSDAAVNVMKNAMSAAANAFESVQKAVKQASDLAEANMSSMAAAGAAATKASKPATTRKKS